MPRKRIFVLHCWRFVSGTIANMGKMNGSDLINAKAAKTCGRRFRDGHNSGVADADPGVIQGVIAEAAHPEALLHVESGVPCLIAFLDGVITNCNKFWPFGWLSLAGFC
jgi:hypothetical protein